MFLQTAAVAIASSHTLSTIIGPVIVLLHHYRHNLSHYLHHVDIVRMTTSEASHSINQLDGRNSWMPKVFITHFKS